jgi:hypothetical protein
MSWVDPALPTSGLIGQITNSTPPIIQYPPAVYNGSCTMYRFGIGCDPSSFTCPTCPPMQINQACSCTRAQDPYTCDPSGAWCNYSYTCTRGCVGIDANTACPGGKYVGPTYVPPGSQSLAAVCSYPISDDNYNSYVTNQFGFPSVFNTGMVYRYIVSKYVQLWNEEVYANPKSIFHQSASDKLARADLRAQISKYNPSQDFVGMLEQMTTYPIPTMTGNNFYLLVTIYGDNMQDPPSATAITKYIQNYTGETLGTPYDPVLGVAVPYPNATSNYVVVDLATNKVYYH